MPDLEDFLDGGDAGQAAAVDPPAVAAEPPEGVEAVAKPPEPPSEADAAVDDEAATLPEDARGLRDALQAERVKRRDHKGRADRLEGEMAALKAQFEAASKATEAKATPPVQEQRQEPVQIPNPIEDPQGYHQFIQRDMFNRSLNMSEAMLRQQVGNDEDVNAKVAKFKEMVAVNPSLRGELERQAHPYKFVYDTAKRSMALEEIGDPDAYRTKLETELRAKIEAELAGTVQQPAAARINLPQSLGTARSAGSRNAPVMNVPENFEDILGLGKR